ncbi:MAG: aminomethyltransferase family protein [Candidatus Acidiferrales bacterium]
MPIGTAVHERTFALCESLNYREWSGYYTVSAYETHHEHEYNAIRNAAALIDVTPLYKYWVTGKDATTFVNRVITRDVRKIAVGQVIYCCWCDEDGKVIDDGTISRLEENIYRWTAADPSLRWLEQNATGLDVKIEDISEATASLALQGPASARLLHAVSDADIAKLKYFHVTRAKIAGVPVDISRTGYTGDLGYEIWMPWDDATRVWDELAARGRQFDLHPAGMLALDVARVEAGLLLIEVDYISSKKALIETQKYSPYEIGLGRMVDLNKEHFVGRDALAAEAKRGSNFGSSRRLVGLDIDWDDIEALHERIGLVPQIASTTSRVAVPIYDTGDAMARQIGKATSTTWSPTLKRMIALASVATEHSSPGTKLKMEYTVEAVRHRVGATVAKLPFFNPARKMAAPEL